MANFDVIEEANLRLERDHSPSGSVVSQSPDDVFVPEPIIVRGVGHFTLFGLSNKFDVDFPSKLTAKLAPEEYALSMARINKVLSRTMPLNIRWLLCGFVCCFCTLGLSMWPVVYLNRRTKHSIEKILDSENCNLYHRLGLHWRLKKQMTDSSNMMEYVLVLETRKKQIIYKPD